MASGRMFRVLGSVEAVVDGVAVRLGGPKQRSVLAVLLIHGGRSVSPSTLIDEVWGARPPATAENTLQVYVSQLRRALGDDVLCRTAGGYELRLAPGSLDADVFESRTA